MKEEKTRYKSLIPDILKLLGVEQGEIFYIEDYEGVGDTPYSFFVSRFTNNIELFSWVLLSDGEYGWFRHNETTFNGLIHGWFKVVKKEEAKDDL